MKKGEVILLLIIVSILFVSGNWDNSDHLTYHKGSEIKIKTDDGNISLQNWIDGNGNWGGKERFHTADEIRVEYGEIDISLQDLIDGKDEEWSSKDVWHKASDIKVNFDGENISLQDYIDIIFERTERREELESWEREFTIPQAIEEDINEIPEVDSLLYKYGIEPKRGSEFEDENDCGKDYAELKEDIEIDDLEENKRYKFICQKQGKSDSKMEKTINLSEEFKIIYSDTEKYDRIWVKKGDNTTYWENIMDSFDYEIALKNGNLKSRVVYSGDVGGGIEGTEEDEKEVKKYAKGLKEKISNNIKMGLRGSENPETLIMIVQNVYSGLDKGDKDDEGEGKALLDIKDKLQDIEEEFERITERGKEIEIIKSDIYQVEKDEEEEEDGEDGSVQPIIAFPDSEGVDTHTVIEIEYKIVDDYELEYSETICPVNKYGVFIDSNWEEGGNLLRDALLFIGELLRAVDPEAEEAVQGIGRGIGNLSLDVIDDIRESKPQEELYQAQWKQVECKIKQVI